MNTSMPSSPGFDSPDAPAAVSAPRHFLAGGHAFPAASLASGLHVVATPIGNLGDISLRALGTLAAADAILAEDTRVTRKLLTHYGISAPLYPYHEHNAADMRPKVMKRLSEGARIALVSDAGTPLISDPGFKLVREVIAEGYAVTPLPGASAVLAGLVLAGLPTDRFFFEGFLPHKTHARRERLSALAKIPGTLVFFETGPRLADSLADCSATLGPRDAVVARELTKLHEEARRGTLADLSAHYAQAPQPRGEIVLLIGPPQEQPPASDSDLDELLRDALQRLSVKDAAAAVAGATGRGKRDVYARALQISQEMKEL